MSVTFTCSHCLNEYVKNRSDEETAETFKKWYPKADITKAKVVCETCYKIAIKRLEIETEHRNWINYAMSN